MHSHSHRPAVFALALVLALGASWTMPSAAFASPPAPAPELTAAPEPVPPPPKSNPGLGLMIAGFSMFIATYALPVSFHGELYPEVGRPLLIPLAGPFISAANAGSVGGGVLAGLFGVFQVTGMAMGISGAVIFGKSRRQARLSTGLGGLQLQF